MEKECQLICEKEDKKKKKKISKIEIKAIY